MAVVFWGLVSMLAFAILGVVLLRAFASKRPSSAAAANEGLQEKQIGLAEDYVASEVKLLVFSTLLFLYPVLLASLLHSKPTVRYWFSDSLFALAIALPAWVILCLIADRFRVFGRWSAPLFIFAVPLFVSAVAYEFQFWSLSGKGIVLLSTDCGASTAKHNLEMAWWSIHDAYADCTMQLADLTGASLHEERGVEYFENCEQLIAVHDRWAAEWSYLKDVEKEQHCGGWCTAQRPIWSQSPTAQDACSKTVAREMMGDIARMTQQAKMYSTFLLLALSSSLLLFEPEVIQWLKN